GGEPLQSSTHTLTIRVCECDTDGDVSSCRNADPHTLPANLSTTALTTVLTCGSVML
ncbi:cadherin-20-like isoform X2, partial [Clarias magur]